MSCDLVVRGRAVLHGGQIGPASIHIEGGEIVAVEDFEAVPAGVEIVEAGDLIVMPGIVDTHVHLNDPGRSDWEGFATGTNAAAVGGVTTVVDMPLNSVPATTSITGMQAKLNASHGALRVDVGLWGGVVPGNSGELEPLLAAGVLGFKCFLVHSGVDEFPSVDESELKQAMPVLARNQAVLLAHAEVPGPIEAAKPEGSPRSYSTYLASRPPAAELEAIELMIRLSREFQARTHIVHLAAASGVPLLRTARENGVAITVETCPHYLVFEAEEIGDGATEFKCAPPIRENAHRELLWKALADGDIDLIATDHSPCPPAMKGTGTGDFFRAWGGIASLQFGLAAVWTEAKRRGLSITKVSDWMSTAPARLAGLAGRKGSIAVGADADLIFFDTEALVDWNRPVEHRHPLTPYRGRELSGVVVRTILRGETVFLNGQLQGERRGEIVRSGLYELNDARAEQAAASLLKCCGSTRWAARMTAARPFANWNSLSEAAKTCAAMLVDEDWLEAFAAHPRIGARSASAWARQEQRSMASAADAIREELAEKNEAYFERFGFIFIICATGKSAAEMLEQLRARLRNSRETEIAFAVAEQRKITVLRLRKLLGI
jgi:allantoinase